jgi:hypothetical protein
MQLRSSAPGEQKAGVPLFLSQLLLPGHLQEALPPKLSLWLSVLRKHEQSTVLTGQDPWTFCPSTVEADVLRQICQVNFPSLAPGEDEHPFQPQHSPPRCYAGPAHTCALFPRSHAPPAPGS